jgi:hypothetical protein
MSVAVVWDDDEKSIIRFIFEGSWTLDELYTAFDEQSQMLDSVDHKVDVIVDFRESNAVPEHLIGNFSRIFQSSGSSHPNTGMTVLVGVGGFAQILADLFSKFFARLPTTTTLEEAHTIIADERARR